MKREFITGLLPDIDKAVLDQIMDEHGKDIEAQKRAVSTLTAERDGLKTQLGEANKKLEGFDPEWKTKAQQAEKDAQTMNNHPFRHGTVQCVQRRMGLVWVGGTLRVISSRLAANAICVRSALSQRANRAAAEIAPRLTLPQAAARRNSQRAALVGLVT